MELTHKLRAAHFEWHTERQIEILERYQFEYSLRTAYADYTDATDPLVLFVHRATPSVGQLFDLTFTPPREETMECNISHALFIPAGDYLVKVPSPGTRLALWKARTNYTAGQTADRVGVYSDGDVVTLEGENNIYFISDEDLYSTENLLGYLASFQEVEVQVPTKVYTDTVIDEPVGFDDLQVTIKRHDYHGMGAEVSLGNLEFYGAAANIIANAYASDIDSEVLYEVRAGDDIIYDGQIDLSTYSEKNGDYRSVSVKVGEIGAKTTFNNRTDKDVNVDDPKTIDGQEVEAPIWRSIHIPIKHLLYTNASKAIIDAVCNADQEYQGQGVKMDIDYPYIMLPNNGDISTEFGSVAFPQACYFSNSTSNFSPQYIKDSDHTTKYGSDTMMHLDVKYLLLAEVFSESFESNPSGSFYWRLCAKDESGNTIQGTQHSILLSKLIVGGFFRMDCDLSGDLHADDNVMFYVEISYGEVSQLLRPYRSMRCVLTIENGSYFKMTMYDNLEEKSPVYADMLFVQDALATVVAAISENELPLYSQYYHVKTPRQNYWGDGARMVLTNGYKIRGLFTNGDMKRNMPLSFKGLIESLSAIDCIGWGFVDINGTTYVKVDRWDEFYDDTVVLTLQDVNEISIDVDTDRIPTELQIGYKKYATQDQYHSIDSPHGKRTFVNSIKAVNKVITKECEFVADNYAIEETRRARTQLNETEESTYDENIFIFELNKHLEVAHAATDAENVGCVAEFINALITPRHMAARWRDYLFSTNNNSPFRFTTGEINYKASFGVDQTEAGITSYAITDPQNENDDITYVPAIFKAEKITFSYPLTIAQYNAVKANPYGLIELTKGNTTVAQGWILDFKYKFEDGTADFTLIAKTL